MSAEGIKPSGTLAIGAITAAVVIGLAALSAALAVIAARGTCSGAGVDVGPSADAKRGIPARYLTLYQQAGRQCGVPWPVLAAIGSLETDHGRSRAPGVRAGVNILPRNRKSDRAKSDARSRPRRELLTPATGARVSVPEYRAGESRST